MGHTPLGLLGSAQSKTAGTALTLTNTSGAIIPAGTVLLFSFVCDNPASTTTPTLTVSAYTGGSAWAANKVTSVGVTTTAGAGIHHFSSWVKTTTNIAAGATICTLTLSASVVARAAIVVGYSGILSLKNSGSSTTASGLSGSSSMGMTSVAAGDVMIDLEAQELATYTPQSSTTLGTWSTAVSLGTTGGSAVTNVVTGAQDKDASTSGGWSNTIQNLSGDQSMHGYLFNPTPTNAAPVANAGPDQRVNSGATVNLTGSGSTDDVGISSYSWAQTGGTPTVTLTGATTATPSFTAPAAGSVLTFTLTVTDTGGLTNTDTVIITVNSPPVANAGPDQRVNSGATVNLTGTGSTDDLGISSYAWVQTAGTPTVTLTGASTSTPSFTAPAAGSVLTFQLTVTDAGGLTNTDTVIVTVNSPPVANAGSDQTVSANAAVNLTGSSSTDDLAVSSYSWAQISGTPTVTLTGATTATPSFTSPASAAVLTFRLTVTDAGGLTSTDDVVITVNAPANTPPVADAGPDQSVVSGATVNLTGSASTDDVGIASYSWKSLGRGAVIMEDDFTRADGAVEATGLYASSASLAANHPQIASNQLVAGGGASASRSIMQVTGDNQFAEVTYRGTTFCFVALQMSAYPNGQALTTLTTQYYILQYTGTILRFEIHDPNASTYTAYTPTYTTTLAVGDRLRAEYVDGVLYGYKNDVLVLTVTPPTAITGNRSVGFGINATQTGTAMFDDFVAGDYDLGSPITLTNPNTAAPSFVAPASPGTYKFLLTVTDASGLKSQDLVSVTVSPAVTAFEGWGVPIS